MSFWKKSEDPWDQKPKKQKPVILESESEKPSPPEGRPRNPGDLLDDFLEKRRAAAKEEAMTNLPPPETCPWCGQDMEQGYMIGQRGTTQWYPGLLTPKNARRAAWSASVNLDGLAILDEGNFVAYKTVWLCRNCKKMVFNMPEPYAPPPPASNEFEESETPEE